MKRYSRPDKIDEIMSGKTRVGKFVPWRIDKQMIATRPESSVGTEIVKHGQYEVIDFSWPRVIRVTITNDMQVHLIGDVPLGADNEDRLNRAVVDASEQCAFLNAHEVR